MDSISIIIRCKNEEEAIDATLQRIFEQNIDFPYEVIAVDSGSTDETPEIISKYPVRLLRIPPGSFTFGYALNYGIEKAKGDIIVNISAHCIPVNTDWLRELVAPIAGMEADATFGRQLPVKGLNPFEEVSLIKHYPQEGKKSGRVPFSNANCAFSKRIWEEQRFDEELPSWEDYLWYILVKDKYRFTYCPKGAVFHTHPFSLKAVTQRKYIDGRAFNLIKKKYGIDVVEGLHPGIGEKTVFFLGDLKNHLNVFVREGYLKYIPLLPLVKFLSYRSYIKGLRSLK